MPRGRPRGPRPDPALRDIVNNPFLPIMLVPRSRQVTRRFTLGPGTHDFNFEPANSREAEVEFLLNDPNSMRPYMPRRRRYARPTMLLRKQCLYCLRPFCTFYPDENFHPYCRRTIIRRFVRRYMRPL